MAKTQLTIYSIYETADRVRIEPGSRDREWMESRDRFAYRCLPLAIANQHGWAVYPNKKITAIWNGGPNPGDVRVTEDGDGIATGHFGDGILTIHVDHVIRVSKGYSLYITGAPNFYKKSIVPLTGVYEADWAPYTFTMNWKFTAPMERVSFDTTDPFCFFFPVERDSLESFSVERKKLEEDAELKEQFDKWSASRESFNEDPNRPAYDWQKHYFQGLMPDGSKCPFDHKTKLNLDGGVGVLDSGNSDSRGLHGESSQDS